MAAPVPAALHDALARPLRDLRLSVTDRCNLRCTYCMPKESFGRDHRFLPRSELLNFEELARVARIFRGLGVGKVRITGGEPLLRREIESLVAMLKDVGGLELAMTTNGVRLAAHADGLADAGLDRVTVSLDALDDETFAAINGVGARVAPVLRGIDAARAAGLSPVKINVVVRRGVNEHAVLPLARRFRGTGCVVRFIEFMDVGATNGWRARDVVPSSRVVETIGRAHALEPLAPSAPGEVARRWRYADGGGEIGVISSVTAPFCGGCTRARLSAEGVLYTCLFAGGGRHLGRLLREGASDDEVSAAIEATWSARRDRYSELRALPAARLPKVEMSYIGG